ncbi:hypothetical protein LBMAG27_08670 [Bacteroidota bacterium]|nr:hypothetical protein LBMAG27_08670 [Bacteroidota bacterium]
MKFKSLINFLFLFYIQIIFCQKISAQKILVSGKVIDAEKKEALVGVTVLADNAAGTYTDLNGNWQLPLSEAAHQIKFSYIGWNDTTVSCSIKSGNEIQLIVLSQKRNTLNEIVVGANRYSRPLAEQTVSMNILHPQELQNKNLQNAADALDQVPGITVIDGQAGIRGGSGYAFGAGSRVMIVVDEQPILSADKNDVKWSFIPMENIEQIEIVKGASSVQYGSAALNGVVNIHTAFPTSKPETKMNLFFTRFDGSIPASQILFGDKNPFSIGGYILHKRKIGRSDFVFDAYGYQSRSWLQGDSAKRIRGHFKYRYRANDKLQFGVNATGMFQNTSQFLFWSNDTTGAYHPLNGSTTLIPLKEIYTTVNPYLTLFSKNGARHNIQLQFYHSNQISLGLWQPVANLFSGDYSYLKEISSWKFSGGINGNIYFFKDDGLGGLHIGNSGAAFFQLEKNWKRFRMEGGARYEIFRIDTLTDHSKPVGRIGIQYTANKKTFIRASFGQGFRVPSPAERFIKYGIGDINIYPNDTLKPESGWSAEIGVRKQLDKKKFNGYVDGALYMMGYKNMMEFAFGQWGKPTDPLIGIGFRAMNVNEARIAGFEFETGAKTFINKVKWNFDGGYTYSYPVDLQADSSLRTPSNFISRFVKGLSQPDSLFKIGLLRYRNRHLLKFNTDFEWKKFSFGGTGHYYSRMDNIDFYFSIFIPGIKDYRATHLQGDWVFDLRFGYQTQYGKVALLCNNLLNAYYAIRVGKPDAPRNFTLQYSFDF